MMNIERKLTGEVYFGVAVFDGQTQPLPFNYAASIFSHEQR